jgi:hypothetical protein
MGSNVKVGGTSWLNPEADARNVRVNYETIFASYTLTLSGVFLEI